MAMSKFGQFNCTGTRVLQGINSPNPEVEAKLVEKVKQAVPAEATAVPSAATPDPGVESIVPPATSGAPPAVPAGSAAETTAGY